jgi:stage II sporulation protein GA (sporulation sigma-E factor processing peptidase)
VVVYIELAVAENLIVNFMLLLFVYKTVRQRPNYRRITLSAILGTIFAVLLPLFSFSGAVLFAIKLFIGLCMVYICQNKNLVRFLLFYLLFVTYTFAFGGAVLSFNSGTNKYIVIGVLLLMFVLFNFLIKFLNVRAAVGSHLRDTVIYYGDNKFKICSFADTGNRLLDPKSSAPVCIISLSLFIKMFPDIEIDKLIMNKLGDEINDGHYINYSTIANRSSKMFVFAPKKIEVAGGKTTDNVRLGVTLHGFGGTVKYDALLNANII